MVRNVHPVPFDENNPEYRKFSLFCAVMKQINDKERVAAAMENNNLRHLVERCIEAQDS